MHPVPGYGFTVVGMSTKELAWVPQSCTLPTVERPLRLAEFDDLFATALRGVERVGPSRLGLSLDESAEGTARDLTARESSCCSFFDFSFAAAADGLIRLEVGVPAARVDVLDALAERAASASGLSP